MRKLTRPGVSLPTLRDIRDRYPLTRTGRGSFPEGKWNNPDVRGALYAMHGRVCAYCGSIASDFRGDVEHYRPKSVYPWLTYEFENYLIGCRVCNSARKSAAFPLLPRARRARYDARMAENRSLLRRVLGRERRLLLDPAEDPVEELIDLDYTRAATFIRAAASSPKAAQRRITATIEFFGLNLIPELVENRSKHVTAAIFAMTSWLDGDASKADEVRMLSNRYTPHGWAVRRVAASLAPTLPLPTEEEDLEWLVLDTLAKLETMDAILTNPFTRASDRDRELVQARKEEASWTLAALWKDPPAATPAAVEGWIARTGRRAEIDAFRQRL